MTFSVAPTIDQLQEEKSKLETSINKLVETHSLVKKGLLWFLFVVVPVGITLYHIVFSQYPLHLLLIATIASLPLSLLFYFLLKLPLKLMTGVIDLLKSDLDQLTAIDPDQELQLQTLLSKHEIALYVNEVKRQGRRLTVKEFNMLNEFFAQSN